MISDSIAIIVMEKNHFSKESMLRKQNQKKGKQKDEAYYVQKIKEPWLSTVQRKTLIMGEDSSDDGYVKVWSSDSKVEEVLRETHGKC